MINQFFRKLHILMLFLFTLQGIAQNVEKQTKEALKSKGYSFINPDVFKPHLKYLSSDEMKGRYTGSKEMNEAADYIASQFKKFGLAPMGDNGAYLQKFSLENVKPDTGGVATTSKGKKFKLMKDFMVLHPRSKKITAINEVIDDVPLVGFGVDDKNYSNYQGTDVKGKTILIIQPTKKPNSIEGLELTLESLVYEAMFKKQARMSIIVTSATDFAKTKEDIASSLSSMEAIRFKGAVVNQNESKYVILITREMAVEVLKEQNLNLASLEKRFLDTTKSITINKLGLNFVVNAQVVDVMTQNVCGMIKGESDNTVVVSAHYDHLGVDSKGQVFNGADDNGSGTSTILALAEAFSKNKKKPKNNILFLGFAGEELGLFGSRYYADVAPIVPLNKTIADINIDMIGRVDSIYEKKSDEKYVYVVGSDKISKELDEMLNVVNAKTSNLKLDYTYNDEKHPLRIYYRSDHYNFAKNNIPVVFFFTGLHKDYHTIYDDYDKINFPKISNLTKMVYCLVWNLSAKTGELKK